LCWPAPAVLEFLATKLRGFDAGMNSFAFMI